MLCFFSAFSFRATAQNKDYSQLTGELQFSKTINDSGLQLYGLGLALVIPLLKARCLKQMCNVICLLALEAFRCLHKGRVVL